MNTSSKRQIQIISACFCLASFLVLGVQAAEPSTESEAGPKVSLSWSSSYAGKTALEQAGSKRGTARVSDYNVSLGTSVRESLSLGLNYSQSDLHFSEDNTTALPSRLRSLAFTMAYSRSFSDVSSGMIFVNPGFHTAGSTAAFDKDAFGVTGGLLYRRQTDLGFAYSLGVVYDSLATGTLHMFPLAGLEWTPSEKWTICLGIPETSVSYKLSDSLKLSLKAEGMGGTYYLEKDEFANDGGRPSLKDSKLEYYDVRLGLALSWNISPSCAVTISAGSVLDRRFDFDKRHYTLKSTGTTGYASIGGSLSF